ncbi:MAG: Hsp20/alpha crystallin family protein [Halobacteriota archaeon]
MVEKKRHPSVPRASVSHEKDAYTIEVELPGVDKKDVEFEASKHSFSVRAPRDDKKYSWSWPLAHAVDPDKANATFSDGLLRATLPIVEREKGAKIPVM